MVRNAAGYAFVVLVIVGVLIGASVWVPRLSSSPLPFAAQPQTIRAAPAVSLAGCDPEPGALEAIEAAVNAMIAHGHGESGAYHVHSICRQGNWAYVYVKGYTPEGEPLPSHSEVVLARWNGEGWEATLPDDAANYNNNLQALPTGLVPEAAKTTLMQPLASDLAALRFSNFALPYPAGEGAYVIKHWYPAIDFSVGANGQGEMIRNAKAGTAVFVKDSSSRACGDPPPDWVCWLWANTIVIQSGPNEFAWYLHFAQNSIPDWIQEGVHVPAGADLGLEGVTGWASGPHVHFMVASTYACCTGSGDSRMPHWPFGTTHRVDFTEYTWEQLPWRAVSQNQSAPASEIGSPPMSSLPQDERTTAPASPPTEVDPASVQAAAPEPQPEAQPPAQPPASAGSDSLCPSPYTVRPGEWLYRIASQCGVRVSGILAANPGLIANLIYAGQQLLLPGGALAPSQPVVQPTTAPPVEAAAPEAAAPAAEQPQPVAVSTSTCSGTHTVAAGENLFRIAFNCGLSTAELAAANGLGAPYTIYPGQVLAFP